MQEETGKAGCVSQLVSTNVCHSTTVRTTTTTTTDDSIRSITWNTVRIAHRRESKFFREHSNSNSTPELFFISVYLQNLQPKRFMPRILQENDRSFSGSRMERERESRTRVDQHSPEDEDEQK